MEMIDLGDELVGYAEAFEIPDFKSLISSVLECSIEDIS